MQNKLLIPLADFVNIFDNLFKVSSLQGVDISFISRIGNALDEKAASYIKLGFTNSCNGLMMDAGKPINRIYGASFLSNKVVDELLQLCCENTLLIVHHPLDIKGGIDGGSTDCHGYQFVDNKHLYTLADNGCSVYSLHFPIDINSSAINTHIALINALNLKYHQRLPLIKQSFYEMGYVLDVAPINLSELENCVAKLSPKVVFYGKKIDASATLSKIGVIAGMISSPAQIEQIEGHGCDVCLCGDVFIRDASERYVLMQEAIAKSKTLFICLSHNISESQVFNNLLFPYINDIWPFLSCSVLRASDFY